MTDIKLSLIKLLKSSNDGLDTSEAWIFFGLFVLFLLTRLPDY